MKLALFASLWGNELAWPEATAFAAGNGYHGVEGPPPESGISIGLPYIAEIATGGGYVPDPRLSPADHLDDFARLLDRSLPFRPLRATTLAGLDAWPLTIAVPFFERLLAIAADRGVPLSVETHRSRPTFSPWTTLALLDELPDLRLTADFSHWCAVAERLVLSTDHGLLARLVGRIDHVHGRVGYDQGAQVPDPRAPEYQPALEAHESWWDAVWEEMDARGTATPTLTPEFGPDGYLQCAPFTRKPVANLREVNRWIGQRQQDRLAAPR